MKDNWQFRGLLMIIFALGWFVGAFLVSMNQPKTSGDFVIIHATNNPANFDTPIEIHKGDIVIIEWANGAADTFTAASDSKITDVRH